MSEDVFDPCGDRLFVDSDKLLGVAQGVQSVSWDKADPLGENHPTVHEVRNRPGADQPLRQNHPK